MPAEIITLQLGNYANHVGAHFWNLQDEAIASSHLEDWSSVAASIDHGVLCSWTEDRHGVAFYSPRTVAVDASGALGGVSFSPDAADAAAAGLARGTWSGPVQVHNAERAPKSTFRQKLEEAGQLDTDDEAVLAAHQSALEAAAVSLHEQHQAKYWTDYLQVDLHPSTVLTLPGVWQGLAALDGWGAAPDTSCSRETAEAAADKVRWWAEQCDKLQGLHVFADDLGGWGGFGCSIVQELREEYPSQPLLYFSLQQPQQQQQQQQQPATTGSPSGSSSSCRRLLSQCISVSEITQLASLYVPVTPSIPGLATHGSSSSSSFQTAALLAAAIDTATLPLRCSGVCTAAGAALGAADLHSLCHLLAGPAANLAALSVQLPAGQITHGGSSSSPVIKLSLAGEGSSSYVLTPGVQLGADDCLAESLTLRGVRSSTGSLASCSNAKEALDGLLLERQQAALGRPCISHACVSPMPVALPLSFPRWLGAVPQAAAAASPAAATAAGSPGINRPALLNPLTSRPGQAATPAPSALSRLTATRGFEALLTGYQRSMQRLGPSAVGRACLEEWGYSAGDADEMQERLIQLAGRYSREEQL